MHETSLFFSLFLVFSGAALVATVALYAGQALLVGYILLGVAVGPWGFDLVSNPALIADIANIGILFLLFLLGLNLEPAELGKLFREATVVTLGSSLIFLIAGGALALAFGFSRIESALIGACMMFSSTIIALKLLPTSALHHQYMGELIVSILLLQDMIAIAVLLLVQSLGGHTLGEPTTLLGESLLMLAGLPLLVFAAWWIATHWLLKLVQRFDQIPEYLFLLAIGWCMGLAEAAVLIGLSHEIGAFIAGVTLATSPIARFIAESLKPLRDFFLVLFFFALGAGLDLGGLSTVWLPTLIFTAMALLLKPRVFRWLLQRDQGKSRMARETGWRLGQISEFSLLVAVVASNTGLLGERAALLVQGATILGFVGSAFWIVKTFPTPIATDPKLRRD